MRMLLPLALVAGLTAVQTQTPQAPPKTPPPPGHRAPAVSPKKSVNPDDTNAAIIKEFLKRVDAYAALRKKVESTLPAMPKQTNPQVLDQHERALATLMQQARKDAKQGDLFTPAMQAFVRHVLTPVFAGRSGAQVRTEIMDNEYKGSVTLTPNGRYPDVIPVSTVPPQVLQNLPKLPEDLEYRFVRQNMILFDPHAHTIPDWVPQAFK